MAQYFMQSSGMQRMPHIVNQMQGSQMPCMPGMQVMPGMNFGNDMISDGQKLLKSDDSAPPKAHKKAKARRTG